MPPLMTAAAVILAVALICVAATRYATLHGDKLHSMRERDYWEGFDDGQAILYNSARHHVAELAHRDHSAPEYRMRTEAPPHQWLADQLSDLYAWSAREQDKARRWYWRTFNSAEWQRRHERPLELEQARPAQLTLELEQ